VAKQDLAQLDSGIVSSIILHNDLSKLSPEQRVEYVGYRCRASGLDPAGSPFTLIPNKEGKLLLYANKECAAQLNERRKLSPVASKEEILFDGKIYKVTYKVTEDGRITEDCGAVSLVWYDKASRTWKLLEGEGLADAIMKAHTKAKRRAILSHCGIGATDISGDEEVIKAAEAVVKEPLVVVDTTPESAKSEPETEKPKPEAKEKKGAKEEKTEKVTVTPWRGKIKLVEEKQIGTGKDALRFWTITGRDGLEFNTRDGSYADLACSLGVNGGDAILAYEVNAKGSKVIRAFQAVGV
jgi:hypothetical protein